LVTTETHSATQTKATSTVYEPQSFVPLLRFEIDVSNKAKAHPSKPEVLHYHCNHIGTPQALIDQSGKIVWQAELDPWGNTRSEYNPRNIQQPIRMQGQQWDEETGLHYNRFRYYDPSLGQYVTQDPIGILGGVNLSAYANQNPNLYTDSIGLAPKLNKDQCASLKKKIQNTKIQINERIIDILDNPNKSPPLPYYPKNPGDPQRTSVQGHEDKIQELKDELKDKEDKYKEGGCDDYDDKSGCSTGCAVVATGATMGLGYLIYRGIRMAPSVVLPPLWPTIPANAAIP
jgi:RHS repeat-associated protein